MRHTAVVLDEDESVDVVREVLDATSRWKEVATQHDIAKLEIERMALAVDHDESEVLAS